VYLRLGGMRFSLDVHIAVINDVKHILNNVYGDKVEFVDWTMSFDWYVLYEKPEVKYITGNTWRYLNSAMISDFVDEYREFYPRLTGLSSRTTRRLCFYTSRSTSP
jgi:hypothetical protein